MEIKKLNSRKEMFSQVRTTKEILEIMLLMQQVFNKIGKFVKVKTCHSFKNKNATQDNLTLDTLLIMDKWIFYHKTLTAKMKSQQIGLEKKQVKTLVIQTRRHPLIILKM